MRNTTRSGMEAAASALISEDSAASRGQVPDEVYIDDERAKEEEEAQSQPSGSQHGNAGPGSSNSAYPPRQPYKDRPDAPQRLSSEFLSSSAPYSGFELSTRRSSVDLRPKADDGRFEKREKRKAFWRRQLVNVALICSWYLFSTLISLYNKWFFSPAHYGFSYPLFVTTFHMGIQFCLAGMVLSFVPCFRPKVAPAPQDYLKKASPCGVATSLDIGLSNLSLKTVTLSFYTMCKSSSLGFVLLFAFLFKLEKPTFKLVAIIAIITAGVIMMVSGETQFSLVGMIQVLSASAMGGLRWALTQKLLDKEAMGLNNPFATLFWLAPIMGFTLALCSLVVEGPIQVFSQDRFWSGFGNTIKTALLICFPGGLAFAMTTSEFALIQRTSVVTLSVAGIFKEVSTIFLGTVVFHDELTPINVSGLCVTLAGIVMYNILKYRQSLKVDQHGAVEPHRFEVLHQRDQDEGEIYAQSGQDSASMHQLPLYNPASEGVEAPVADETLYAVGSDSEDDEDDAKDARQQREDEERGYHPEHQSLDSAPIPGLEGKLKSDAHLVKLEEEERSLEDSLNRSTQR